MERLTCLMTIATVMSLMSCSNKSLDNLSDVESSGAGRYHVGKQHMEPSNELHVRDDLSKVTFTKNEIAKLKPVLQGENGEAMKEGSTLLPNTVYKIIVNKSKPCSVSIKQGYGFSVSSSSEESGSTTFTVRTNPEVPDRLVLSLVPKTLSSSRVYVNRPQDFLLPN